MAINSANDGNGNQKRTFHLLFYFIVIIFTQTLHTFFVDAYNYDDIWKLNEFELTPNTVQYLDNIYKVQSPRLWALYSNIFTDVLFTHFRQEIEVEFNNSPGGRDSPLLTFLDDLGLLPESYRNSRSGQPFKKLQVEWNNFKARLQQQPSQVKVPPPPEMVVVPMEFRVMLKMRNQKTSTSYNNLKKRFLFYASGYNPKDKWRKSSFTVPRYNTASKRLALVRAIYYVLVLEPFFRIVHERDPSHFPSTSSADWDHPNFDPIAALGLPVSNIEKSKPNPNDEPLDLEGLDDFGVDNPHENDNVDWGKVVKDGSAVKEGTNDEPLDLDGLEYFGIDNSNENDNVDWGQYLENLDSEPAQKKPRLRNLENAKKISKSGNGFNIGGPFTMLMGMVIFSIAGLIIYAIFSVVSGQNFNSTALTDDSETLALTSIPEVIAAGN